MIPVALLYAAFTWQGQHPVVSPTANRETWQAVAATAGIETLRVMATLWLPLLAGGIAFATLRRDMPTSGELASCAPAIASQTA